jgi:zinc transport system permease protein
MAGWLDYLVFQFTDWAKNVFGDYSGPGQTFNVYAFLAIVLVALVCGSVGSMVVGNRMAFFSDALAHCAFAGVALGFLIALLAGVPKEAYSSWQAGIMIAFGISVGLLIAFVREKTNLASDTVIGVFFAGAVGFGAIFVRTATGRGLFNLESFLFGDPLTAGATDIINLLGLVTLTGAFLVLLYNSLVFTSFNPSLARSRRVPVRLSYYLFVALLGVIVNMCIQIVGVLLINALLIVPAATAANVCRNMRQLFWWSIGLCLIVGVSGQIASWELSNRLRLELGIGGTIVVLSVVVFAGSMMLGPWLRDRGFRVGLAEDRDLKSDAVVKV